MAILDVLSAWIPHQRWFSGKAHQPRLRILEAAPGVCPGAVTYFVMDDAGARPTLYQVPVVAVDTVPAGADDAVVGEADGRVLLDAPRHHDFAVALLGAMGVPTDAITGSDVMRGEQSNTSIVYSEGGARTIIAKLFRTLHHGENPDVTLQSALSAAGSPFVPRFLGELPGTWPDVGRQEGAARGTLAFAQEFLPGVRDGWTIALEAAHENRPFGDAAHDLGFAVAGVHRILAEVMPTRIPTPDDVDAMTGAWARRLELAADEVPAIAERRAEIEAIYRIAREEEWPPLQRIHGDLHLGQVLAVPNGGWRIVDFEGEPLRPMSERSTPDVAVRDVAGMLRSFDYAAGATGEDRAGWATACREVFLDGYRESGGEVDRHLVLLGAFALDKAVYEAVYESRNRPDWLGIPLQGVDGILAQVRRA
jgi:predicted trehalose synthase